MRRIVKVLIVSAVVLAGAPIQARADDFANFWIGHQATDSTDGGRAAFGITAGGMGAGIFGGELDFGYSPSFFGTENEFGHNTLLNLTGNLMIGIPIGGTRGVGIRPFVRGGAGLIRTQIDGGTLFNVSSSQNQIGWDLGGGVMGFFNDHVGLRGDLTYFRTVTGNTINNLDLGALHFWRLGFGVVVR
jgi:hypothetical protein